MEYKEPCGSGRRKECIMTEKPDTTKPFLLARENRYLWFALILPAYLLVFAWV